MSKNISSSNMASHITTSGGLMSAAFIESIREPSIRRAGVEPESFSLPWREAPKGPAALAKQMATAWELLREQWDAVRAELRPPLAPPNFGGGMGVSEVRRRWLIPLFELLDFEPHYLRADTVIGESQRLRFSLSHRGWKQDSPLPEGREAVFVPEGLGVRVMRAPVLHTVAASQGLDERVEGGRAFKGKSPHDMVQVFLNVSSDERWAVLSNGIMLRILRDYHHTFTKGYVQFDLESIFETRNFADFRALYRLCHASRFISIGEEPEPLEHFYKEALATGIKVGEALRGQVREAIETLGNGFLVQQGALIAQLQSDGEACRAFYSEILRVVYRILFLLFAEQRGMMPKHDAPLADLYREQYTMTALRTLAESDLSRHAGHDFTDLWEGLQVTFRMVRDGAAELGVFGYNGMLFDGAAPPQSPPILGGKLNSPLPRLGEGLGVRASDSGLGVRAVRANSCPNSALLRAMRALTLIEREGVLQRISYADLGVEELGSIYESLLDFTPRVTGQPEVVAGREIAANTFFLDPRGMERKTSGSYYTHPSLVNELIKSALLPVMWARLREAGLPVIAEHEIASSTTGLLVDYTSLHPTGMISEIQRQKGVEALLNLKICDPAAGSGHFLVRANNVLGAEVARVRHGEEYPTQKALQLAKRDVLTGCIYAVDLNPMAVELCRVSLWINASVRDQKLNFLDHHIKCGNSLVGATPELLKDGIPANAFALGRTGDDRAVAKRIRKENRKERRDWEKARAVQSSMWRVTTVLSTLEELQIWSELNQLAANQPKLARERYESYQTSAHHRRQKLEADFWTAAFFWPMAKGTPWAPTFAEFRRLRDEGEEAIPPAMQAKVAELAREHHFFHWYLKFPDVFGEEGTSLDDDQGGFDVILGNPPWERIKLQEKEFFANRDEGIANASTAAKRRKLIKALPKRKPQLHRDYQQALYFSEASSNFLRKSGHYPLSAKGDINTYQIFAALQEFVP